MNQKTNYVPIASYEPKRAKDVKKVVLLYSGGLDTSVMLKWIQDVYKAEVVALCVDIGQQVDDLEKIKQKALDLGAVKSIVIDAKDIFAEKYISRGIKANAAYQGAYHMSTPIGRPLLAKIAVQVAAEEKADAIAHGCTGKGNDQVRIEGTAVTLNPDIKIIAPVRAWGMGRDEEIDYAKKNNIPIPNTADKPYSCDDNMWGATWEGGEIENPELVPQLENFLQVCTLPSKAPDQERIVRLEFVKGLPVALDGQEMKLSELIIKLNKIAGEHGIGISHHIEDRIVGLKVRGVYEMPAAHTIIEAHKNLEKYVCTRLENKFKTIIDHEWAYNCYSGLWYEPLMADLSGFIDKMNEKVNGEVSLRMYKGNLDVVALKTPDALFDEKLATFMKSDLFNQNASPGFIELWTLPMKMAKQTKKNILVSIHGDDQRHELLPEIKILKNLGCNLYATSKTSKFLDKNGIDNYFVYKVSEEDSPNISILMRDRRFDLIINIKNGDEDKQVDLDADKIRQEAVRHNVPLVTDIMVAKDIINQLQESIKDKGWS